MLEQLSLGVNDQPLLTQYSTSQDDDHRNTLDQQGDLMEFNLLDENDQQAALDGPSRYSHLAVLEESFAADTLKDQEVDSMAKPSISRFSEAVQDVQLPEQVGELETSDLDTNSLAQDGNTVEMLSEKSEKSPDLHIESPKPVSPVHSTNLSDKMRDIEGCDIPSLLFRAVTQGNLVEVTKVLDDLCDIETRLPPNNRTGLILAAYHGHLDILQLLLERGAAVDAVDRDERTALYYAVSEGSLDSVNLLISKGASITRQDFLGEIPLHRASRYGRADICEILLLSSPNCLRMLAKHRRNALHIAVSYHQHQVVRTICNHLRQHMTNFHAGKVEGIQPFNASFV